LFAGKPAAEWQRRPRLIELEILDALAQGWPLVFSQDASRLSQPAAKSRMFLPWRPSLT
jgi:hypothetical protein